MRNNLELGEHVVVCQKWEERERGWGSRPEGFSLHVSYEGLARYIKTYWARMPAATPDEYSCPSGTPYPIGVSDAVLAEVAAAGDGLRYFSFGNNPGSGGIDGWLPVATRPDGSLDL